MTLDQKEEKSKPALFEHLLRWQTAKSALAPVVRATHSDLIQCFFITVQISPEPDWAVLPAGHQDANTSILACEWHSHSAKHARLFFWQWQIFRSAYCIQSSDTNRVMCSHFGQTDTSSYGEFSQTPSALEIPNYSFQLLYLGRKKNPTIFLIVWVKPFLQLGTSALVSWIFLSKFIFNTKVRGAEKQLQI